MTFHCREEPVHAVCMGCGTELDVRQADDAWLVRRRCLCPWTPNARTYAALPGVSRKPDPVELVRAW